MRAKKRLLVLGNGPSLGIDDFPKFRGVDSIGMNAAYRFWDRIGWYPAYYACLDAQVVVSHADAIAGMVRAGRFRQAFLHWHFLKRHPELADDPRLTFLCQLVDGEDNVKRCAALGLAHCPSRFFPPRSTELFTTGSSSIRFAAHLGYRDVGVIGIDCRYQEILPEASSQGGYVLRIDRPIQRNPNYFFEDYQRPGDLYHVPNPPVIDGNLHLHCMTMVGEDNLADDYGLRIRVLTRNSQLFDDAIFPYEELDGFLGLK